MTFDGITTLSFDLDDTLWPVRPVIERAEAAMRAWLDAQYPRIAEHFDAEASRALRRRVVAAAPERAHDLTWLRRRVLSEMAAAAGYPEALVDGAFEIFDTARNSVRHYDDALPVLAALAGRYRLVALSNGNARLGPTGLSRYFSAHVSARDAGAAKPDARMFRAAETAARARPEEMLHVGDDPHRDVQAAVDAGQRAVWLNRTGREWPDDLSHRPLQVGNLHELARLLGGG